MKGYSDFRMDSSLCRGSVRFTARKTSTLRDVQLYFAQLTGNPKYEVSLQSDSGGLPSGVLLGAPVTQSIDRAGWTTVTFADPPSVTQGQAYHIVISYQVVSGMAWALWRNGTLPEYHLYPYDQALDPNQYTVRDIGMGYRAYVDEAPVFIVGYGDGTYDGNPYAESAEFALNNGQVLGQRFVVAGAPLTFQAVGAYLRKEGSPSAPVSWSVQTDEAVGRTVCSGLLADSSAVSSGMTWVDASTGIRILPLASIASC
jgi:hypothetical protein